MAKSTLVDDFLAATSEDLNGIAAKINVIEEEITQRQNLLKSLVTLRRTLSVKINGRPPRKARETVKKPDVEAADKYEQLAGRIHDFISANGPQRMAVIALRMNEHHKTCNKAIDDSGWFARANDEVRIAKAKGVAS